MGKNFLKDICIFATINQLFDCVFSDDKIGGIYYKFTPYIFFKNRGKYVSEQRENKEARKYILDMGKEGWSQ